jgi:preprotein translocase subunit SecA
MAAAPATVKEAQDEGATEATKAFHAKLESLGEYGGRLLALVMLNVLDEKWKDHLYDLDQLRAAIGYRSWGQKDPLVEYKQEAFSMFEDLMRDIQHTFAERFLKVQLVFDPPPQPLPPIITSTSGPSDSAPSGAADPFGMPPAKPAGRPAGGAPVAPPAPKRDPEYVNVGRNDACPCGSGKKFKKCHGA